MSETVPSSSRDVAHFFNNGRLTAIPRKAARREQLLTHLTRTLFEPERTYNEAEVNATLRTVHDDSAALRRYMVTSGLLVRSTDGRTYRAPGAAEHPQP